MRGSLLVFLGALIVPAIIIFSIIYEGLKGQGMWY